MVRQSDRDIDRRAVEEPGQRRGGAGHEIDLAAPAEKAHDHPAVAIAVKAEMDRHTMPRITPPP